jgi:hypothetical protein
VYKRIVEVFNENEVVFTDRQLPPVRTIDINMGQPEDPESFEMFLPAIYIGWNKTPGPDVEPDILTLDFHVLQDPGTGSENFSSELDAGLEYLRLLEAVKYLLNYLRANNTTPLKWAGERQAITPYFKYHILTYTCSVDAYNDSVHRPQYREDTIEEINVNQGRVKQNKPSEIPPEPDPPIIETFK